MADDRDGARLRGIVRLGGAVERGPGARGQVGAVEAEIHDEVARHGGRLALAQRLVQKRQRLLGGHGALGAIALGVEQEQVLLPHRLGAGTGLRSLVLVGGDDVNDTVVERRGVAVHAEIAGGDRRGLLPGLGLLGLGDVGGGVLPADHTGLAAPELGVLLRQRAGEAGAAVIRRQVVLGREGRAERRAGKLRAARHRERRAPQHQTNNSLHPSLRSVRSVALRALHSFSPTQTADRDFVNHAGAQISMARSSRHALGP